MRHKLGPEDIHRITHKAAAAAEAALHHSLQEEEQRDKSLAGASRYRSCLHCTLRMFTESHYDAQHSL